MLVTIVLVHVSLRDMRVTYVASDQTVPVRSTGILLARLAYGNGFLELYLKLRLLFDCSWTLLHVPFLVGITLVILLLGTSRRQALLRVAGIHDTRCIRSLAKVFGY